MLPPQVTVLIDGQVYNQHRIQLVLNVSMLFAAAVCTWCVMQVCFLPQRYHLNPLRQSRHPQLWPMEGARSRFRMQSGTGGTSPGSSAAKKMSFMCAWDVGHGE